VTSLDIAHYKEVVGHYVTGVVVISATTDEGPVGFACQNFGSLSLDPILVSFAVTSQSRSWSKVRTAKAVGVNILSSEQEALARVFGTSGVDKFNGVGWSAGPEGTPFLDGALAHLEGAIVSVATHGDHDFVVVAVEHVSAHSGAPLVYYRGGFGLLD
jgi:3-hydroxy-9,10-secoandrosta-1,3,5(10)-triene-9,17-dione monooxygenase reductase component